MAYQLHTVTIRTNNTPAGMEKIQELWQDVASGKLPILFDSNHHFQQGISPVSKYSHYATDETGDYDYSIIGVTAAFFKKMEVLVSEGRYKKYEVRDDCGDIGVCTKKAWEMVWDNQKKDVIHRAFTEDYESAVPPEYTKDGKAHCYLYISVES